MNHNPHTPDDRHGAARGTLTSYTCGFILSIILTLIPYLMVVKHTFTGNGLVAVLIIFAIAQLLVQLVFFLHLGRESKPKWNLLIFIFTVLIVLILVIGTLWIMQNLNYHMAPTEVDQKIFENEAIPRRSR